MKKLSIFWYKSQKKDILIWDNIIQDSLIKSFGEYSWTSLNTRDYVNIAPLYFLKALRIFFKDLDLLKHCSVGIINKGKFPIFLCKIIGILKKARYSFKCILSLSVVFYFKPRLIITNIDNTIYFQYLDSIVNRFIPVITLQTGNRWHSETILRKKAFKHFYDPPGFHSCFGTLSEVDIKMYKDSKWVCNEYHNIGSLSAAKAYEESRVKNLFDLCVVASSSNNRLSEKKLAELLNNFKGIENLKVCVVLKLNPNNEGFLSYYNDIQDLYGNIAYKIPNNSFNLSLICSSRVILGTFSTALRESFSLGKKIYPINFDLAELNSYTNFLNLNYQPTQEEFNKELKKLLLLDEQIYKQTYKKEIEYMGSFPRDINPNKRLSLLINSKLK